MPLVDPPVECDVRCVYGCCGHIILQLHMHALTPSWQHSLSSSVHFSPSPLLSPLFSVLVFLLSSLTPLAKVSVCFYSTSSLSLHLVDSEFQRECPISAVIQAEKKTFCSFSLWNWKYINSNRPFPNSAQYYLPNLKNIINVYLFVKNMSSFA